MLTTIVPDGAALLRTPSVQPSCLTQPDCNPSCSSSGSPSPSPTVTTGFRDKPWLLVLGTLGAAWLLVFFANLSTPSKTLDLSERLGRVVQRAAATSPRPRFSERLLSKPTHQTGPNSLHPLGPSPSCSPSSWVAACVAARSCATATAPPSCSACGGLCSDLHGVERRSIYMFNATPIMAVLGAAGIVAFWRVGRLGSDWSARGRKFGIQDARTDRIAGARKAAVAHAAILCRVPRQDHDFRPAGHLRFGLRHPGDCHPGRLSIDERIYNIVPDILAASTHLVSLFSDSDDVRSTTLPRQLSDPRSTTPGGTPPTTGWRTRTCRDGLLRQTRVRLVGWDYGFQVAEHR